MIGILTLLAFSIGYKTRGLIVARTMAFTSLGTLELIHSLNVRTEKSIFKENIFKNIYLIGAIILGTGMQIIVTMIPSISRLFQVTSLNKIEWIVVILISIMPIILEEIQKKLNEIKYGEAFFIKQED